LPRRLAAPDYDARDKGLAENFKEIGEQLLRSAYELRYHSSDTALDDTFHKISIRERCETYSAGEDGVLRAGL
jgi:hypothetical protein